MCLFKILVWPKYRLLNKSITRNRTIISNNSYLTLCLTNKKNFRICKDPVNLTTKKVIVCLKIKCLISLVYVRYRTILLDIFRLFGLYLYACAVENPEISKILCETEHCQNTTQRSA